VVKLTAVPNANFEFDYWTGACSGSSPVCSLTMNSPLSATAHFSVLENWVTLYPGKSPPLREDAAMAYDTLHRYSVMFGGIEGTPGQNAAVLGDTWIWDGVTWTRQTVTKGPSARWGAMMAWDAANGQIVMFGGRQNGKNAAEAGLADTWVWDAANNEWVQKSATGPARFEGSLAYDPNSRMVILFGGATGTTTLGDTWGWNGAAWTRLNPARSPNPRASAGMAFHAATNRMVLFGGSATVQPSGLEQLPFGDTWEWDGVTWTARTPALRPPTLFTPTLVYNSSTQETTLFEALNFTGATQQTWVWDGSQWFQKTPANSPASRDRHSLVYDSARNEVVLFGGIDILNATPFNDTWVYLAPVVSLVPQTPALTRNGANYQVTIPLANTGNVPATNVTLNTVSLGNATANNPVSAGTINRGDTGSISVSLPVAVAGPPGTHGAVSFQGTFNADGVTGIPWTASFPVTFP